MGTKTESAKKTVSRAASKVSRTASKASRAASKGSRTASKKPPRAPSKSRKSALLYCVRLTDGYYFPAPNSQFVGVDHADNTLDRCRFICEDADMGVYVLNNASLETHEMVSAANGEPYQELSAAFRYRGVQSFQGCNFARYHERSRLLRAREATVSSMMNVVIPIPARPPRVVYVEADGEALPDPSPVSSIRGEGEDAASAQVAAPGKAPEE
ncbi:DUF2865 domain-containing protein [Chelativorans sp. AA-79]|uniref:DUF2865 domain-containing protein n=1 Tax=Chelativorans sp. AA-79 TaxID=3028735 RepID=UPI0023FA2FEC|nr:DUF2865 domain-containing protein [Chelativorans sp. AA-79]WEX08231.1 DUF2865 domain-containing protein [Chelativorans sp. AA-79]